MHIMTHMSMHIINFVFSIDDNLVIIWWYDVWYVDLLNTNTQEINQIQINVKKEINKIDKNHFMVSYINIENIKKFYPTSP